MNIFITGSTGFVGTNLLKYLGDIHHYSKYVRNSILNISEDIELVIHLAGKAHDLKNKSIYNEYIQVNTELTKTIYDAFLASKAKVFISLSSVKALADEVEGVLTEECIPNPASNYGKSKLLADEYILSKQIPEGKRVYILRPCMIHGPGNKGNLNLLYKFVSIGFPWPLGSFKNQRSFCSIDNLSFIINELIYRQNIPSGVYIISDDESLSTNEVISLLAKSQNKKIKILKIPVGVIISLAKLGDLFRLPLTTERLKKLTESYVVSNQKIKSAIGKNLQFSAKDGLLKTFNSFSKHVN
jgi:nucleoside-diphosphate-sugar epimerase